MFRIFITKDRLSQKWILALKKYIYPLVNNRSARWNANDLRFNRHAYLRSHVNVIFLNAARTSIDVVKPLCWKVNLIWIDEPVCPRYWKQTEQAMTHYDRSSSCWRSRWSRTGPRDRIRVASIHDSQLTSGWAPGSNVFAVLRDIHVA